MPCEKPIPAFQPANGGALKFKAPADGRAYIPIQIPCGTCILCRENQAREWGIRITHEAQMHERSSFVTLSYNDKHLPQYGSLQYEDLQKFWKRMRKNYGPLRYYAVGEYGDNTQRPHYHACIFGHDFSVGRTILRTTPNYLWTHPLLEKSWGCGNVAIGTLNFQTASYTASYVTKKLRSKQQYVRVDDETGELIALEQPKAMMSRNIALEWFKQYGKGVQDHDYVVIQGKRQKPPKAYDQYLKKSGPEGELKLKAIKEKRKQKAVKQTPDQLRARAKNAHARKKQQNKTV